MLGRQIIIIFEQSYLLQKHPESLYLVVADFGDDFPGFVWQKTKRCGIGKS